MIELAALVVFPVLMAFAATSDLLTMTISNRISLALFAGFFVMALALQLPWQEVLLHLSCGAAILCITFALFCFGWIGGGDAKLAASTAVWLGWSHILDYGLVASVLGGLLTIALLQVRKWALPSWAMQATWVSRLHDKATGVPYGIALAVAGLLIYPDTIVWLRVIGAQVGN
jgi:prepilin peptidase CpaA